MLLFNEINSQLEAFGFDPFMGFLHSMRYGNATLAMDLIEEYRSPVVDRLVIYLINLGVVKKSQFSQKEKGGVKMDDKARRAFLNNYEKFMTTRFADYKTRARKNFRQVIRDKILEVERYLLDGKMYKPYVFY